MDRELDMTRLTALFDSSPDAIVVVGPDGEILRANERVRDIFGYEPRELEGEAVEILVPEADRARHPDQRDSYMADPTVRPMGAGLDLRARRKDGSTFPVDISLSPIESEEGIEVIAAVRDRSKSEKLQRKYRTIMETAPDAVVIAELETGTILEVNERATELLETSEEQLVGRTQAALHPDGEADRYREFFEFHAGSDQRTFSRFPNGDELFVQTDSGERIPVEISAHVTELSDQRVMVGVFRDISDRRTYERELHRQIERLETLTKVLSHDLRNPLNVAEANVELAKAGDLERLQKVRDSHARMEQLIDEALTLIQEGYEVKSVEAVELESLVSTCWQHVRTDGATLRIESDGVLYADPSRVMNLFENLFSNAVEHGGDDVTVRVGLSENRFYVADDGPGIPAEDRADVLEPGWTSATGGNGLGLNIVSEIAEAHGWEIHVAESDAGGARFAFTGVETDLPGDRSLIAEDE